MRHFHGWAGWVLQVMTIVGLSLTLVGCGGDDKKVKDIKDSEDAKKADEAGRQYMQDFMKNKKAPAKNTGAAPK